MAKAASQEVAMTRGDRIKAELARIAVAELPEALAYKLDLRDWSRSLILGEPFKDKDPDLLSREMLINTLLAGDPTTAGGPEQLPKMQEILPDNEGAYFGPLTITDVTVTESDFGEGAPCYMILNWFDHDTTREQRASTGATQFQMQIMLALSYGHWPLTGRITRLPAKDKGDRHLIYWAPPEGF